MSHFPTRDYRGAFGFEAPPLHGFATHLNETARGRAFGRGPKGYRRSDERIKEEISDRLMASPDIDASELELDVKDGIVTLTGVVDARHEKRLAEYIAEDALGVNDVDNRLKVRHGFWAAVTGERVLEHDAPSSTRGTAGSASKEGLRRESARDAARRDAGSR